MRKIAIWPLLVALVLILSGCAPESGDYFAPFRGNFTARLEGEWRGVDFEAQLVADAPDASGARVMTLTFYAPSTLSGTVLSKDAAGALTLAVDGISLPLSPTAAAGYGVLFELFPTAGEVCSITQENGNIRLDGDGFSLLFASDGTPLVAESSTARVEVKEWKAR